MIIILLDNSSINSFLIQKWLIPIHLAQNCLIFRAIKKVSGVIWRHVVAAFYEKHGFNPFCGSARKLFLPMKTIAEAAQQFAR